MRILVSGSHGFIGSALVAFLAEAGHGVTRLIRGAPQEGEARWDPASGEVDAAGLEGHEAVVHLAGESLIGRWTAAKKARIRESRVGGTRRLCEALARLERRPRVLLSASAVGFYGHRGEELVNEESPPGEGFLPELCMAWEEATRPAAEAGLRVVCLRFGLVLSAEGGALAKMLPIFRLGLGGVLGSGRQEMSWITLEDAVRAVAFALEAERLAGPVNLVTQDALTNRDFTKTLGRVLRRPTLCRVPGFVARLALGEMAREMLLRGARVEPARLFAAGFDFEHPELEDALRHLLGRQREE
jgi:uncharacterized protein (TIGR01777 family)